MKLSVLVPAHNEERTIAQVLTQVARFDAAALGVELEVVVCDDGSTDRTSDEVRRVQANHPNVRLVSHQRNGGKGRAIRTALAHAKGDYALIQDADLEYCVADYPALIAAARAGADVVYGSRFLARRLPRGMHAANYVANRLLTATSNVLFGQRITDEATCFKLFRTGLLSSLDLTCERFEFCPEVTAKLGLLRIPIVEVPIAYRGRDAKNGKKVRWTDGVEALAVLVRHRLQPAEQLAWSNPRH